MIYINKKQMEHINKNIIQKINEGTTASGKNFIAIKNNLGIDLFPEYDDYYTAGDFVKKEDEEDE